MPPQNNQTIIAHLIYRFDIGGLERVMVNCINQLAGPDYCHIVIALTEISDFAEHLKEPAELISLHKKDGNDLSLHKRLYQLLKSRQVDILHTYNLATIEYHVAARLAGVKGHIHAEHGRDIHDPQGKNWKHNLLRRLLQPFIHYYVPVSADLAGWLKQTVKIASNKIKLIYNGISDTQFQPISRDYSADKIHFGTVARLVPIKDQSTLLNGFAEFVSMYNGEARLTLVGDGSCRSELENLTKQLNLTGKVTFVGNQNNVADYLGEFDVFVLSSLAEGIPMTVLEAMATGLPVISTNVGGLSEIIDEQQGILVPSSDPSAMAQAMLQLASDKQQREQFSQAAQQKVQQKFSEQVMVNAYIKLYQSIRTH